MVPNGAAGLVEVTASLAPVTEYSYISCCSWLLLIAWLLNTKGYMSLNEAYMGLQYFVEDCNQRLVDNLEERADELSSLRTPLRVRLALKARLEMLIPVMGELLASLASQS